MRRLGQVRAAYDGAVPPSLKPVFRAYALGYLSVTGPRLFGFLRLVIRKDVELQQKIKVLYTILKTSTQINRFPTACAVIVSGATALPRLVKSVLEWLLKATQGRTARNLGPRVLSWVRFITTFLSAWAAFGLLNQDQEWSRKRAKMLSAMAKTEKDSKPEQDDKVDIVNESAELAAAAVGIDVVDDSLPDQPAILDYPNQHHLPPPGTRTSWAGKTIDLTLFALCRAIDVAVYQLWSNKLSTRPSLVKRPGLRSLLASMADPATFTLCTAVIMHAWFYEPDRLPKSYNHWISSAAKIDDRLIRILRLCRQGDIIYGVDTGYANVCGSLARDLGLPESFGDPKLSIPIPCEVVHCGTGASCEYHALSRWVRSFLFAMKLYLPLQVLTNISPFLQTPYYIKRMQILTSILRSSARSSTFLATFIGLFYYTVCLIRTRLPQLYCLMINYSPFLSKTRRSSFDGDNDDNNDRYGYKRISAATRLAIDRGWCIIGACLTCGLSVLTERPGRRAEFAQFVAPRAMATLLPRIYDARHLWKEQVVFAMSASVVLNAVVSGNVANTATSEQRKYVRGVLGRVLGPILQEG